MPQVAVKVKDNTDMQEVKKDLTSSGFIVQSCLAGIGVIVGTYGGPIGALRRIAGVDAVEASRDDYKTQTS